MKQSDFERLCREARREGDRRRVARGGRRADDGLGELARRTEAALMPPLGDDEPVPPSAYYAEHMGRIELLAPETAL